MPPVSLEKIRHSCSRAKSDIRIISRLSATAGSLSENTNHTLYPIIAFCGIYSLKYMPIGKIEYIIYEKSFPVKAFISVFRHIS